MRVHRKQERFGHQAGSMVRHVVMATMTHRTTFAPDEETMDKLRKLSSRWKVFFAEAVLRAVPQAELQDKAQRPNPVELLQQPHDSGQSLDPKKAKAYLTQVYEDRKHGLTLISAP